MLLNDYKSVRYDFDEVGEYRPWIFTRGWLLTSGEAPTVLLGDWAEHVLGRYQLYLHPSAVLTHSKHLWVIGQIFDIRRPKRCNFDVAEVLSAAWRTSEQTFHRELSYCNGCFALIVVDGDRVRIYTDATGMSAVFYTSDLSMAGSHSLLVAMNEAGSTTVERYDIYAKFGCPGRLARYRGVYSLNPGCHLTMDGGVARYKHRTPLPPMRYSRVLKEFSKSIRASMEAFAHRKPLVMSLTAGFDSRTALAAAKRINGIEYFTYYRTDDIDTDKVDRAIASTLADVHSLDHKIIMLRQSPSPKAYKRLCEFNAHYSHIQSASYNYFERWGKRDVFHVRSNLSEIGRAFYSSQLPGESPRPATVETALKCYVTNAMRKNRNYDATTDENYHVIYLDYITSSEASAIDSSYDYRDIFYWEHRMGSWHAQVVAESAAAFESLSVYNCDYILQLMLQPGFSDRRNNRLMLGSIKRNWPELLKIPINPRTLTMQDTTWKPRRRLVGGVGDLLSHTPLSGVTRLLRKFRRHSTGEAIAVIAQSPLFDAEWYMQQYPELANDAIAKKNPARHYLEKGGFEGRDPSPKFRSRWYLETNYDVKSVGMNPLLHYILHGAGEGRTPKSHANA